MNICVDAHSHFLPASILDMLKREGARYGTPVQTRDDGGIFVVTPERPYGPIGPGFYDLDVRRDYLATHKISTQVLAPPPFLFYYWVDPKLGIEIMRAENDAIADAVAGSGGVFEGLGAIPMHDTALAVRELERLAAAGLRGVEIGSNINGIDLDDQRFWPIYEAAEALGSAILIHPNNVVGSDRMRDFHLQNLIGFPADTTLAAARLIFAGVLDRFPKLKINLGQAGGFLPFIIGRLDHGYRARPECRRYASREPSRYLRMFYYDTIIHAPGPLKFLLDSVGSERLMLGTDFPFDMGSCNPHADIDAQHPITPHERARLRYGTALEFLGLQQPAAPAANGKALRAVAAVLLVAGATFLGSIAGVGASFAAGRPQTAVAGGYPTRPIRMVVPLAVGGAVDTVARVVMPALAETLGEQIVIDNRPGAGGVIGTEIAATAVADGYTGLMWDNSLTVIPNLFKSLPFEPTKDFMPVATVSSVPFVLVAGPSTTIKSVDDLIHLAKSQPNMNFGSAGVGSPPHLSAELFAAMAGVKFTHVPFKGAPQALTEVMAGRLPFMFVSMPLAKPQIEAGKIRGLAVTTIKRSMALPGLVTVNEAGLKGYDVTVWNGVFMPRGTPPGIIAKLSADIIVALGTNDIKEKLAARGAEPLIMTQQDFAKYFQLEFRKWAKVVKQSGATPE